MDDQKIVCPECRAEFPLTAALTQHLEERIRHSYDQRAEADRARIEREAVRRVREELSVELKDSAAAADEARRKLAESEARELDFRRQAREWADKERTLMLAFERRLDEERDKLVDSARRQAGEESELRLAEKEKQIADLRRSIEELKRRAEQGSQQAQGEILEVELEKLLGEYFPEDEIVPVPKGRRGADLLQRVRRNGQGCGTIIWEAKRTKAWSNDWLAKLKEDRDQERADLAALVSTVLPKEVRYLGQIEGVWVCEVGTVLGTATLLRKLLIDNFTVRQSLRGRADKKELLYNYLASTEFGQRIEGLCETFREMKRELDQERAAFQRIWARREKQLDQFMEHTARMYGDLQGILGAGLSEVTGLTLPGTEERPLLEGAGSDD